MIVAISGTGTGVGKTHVACALISGLRARGVDAVGWKPVESGVSPAGSPDSDESKIREASRCGPPASPASIPRTLRLSAPLSPHLAARREGIVIDGARIRTHLEDLVARHDLVVLELAGGLHSPFDDRLDNADWLAALRDIRLIVVAPDRLGVLHDVTATTRGAAQAGLGVTAIALCAPALADDSTGTNAAELRTRPALRGIGVVELPRAPVATLAEVGPLLDLAR